MFSWLRRTARSANDLEIWQVGTMDENNIEVVVKPASWQTPGKALRWSWQVRQQRPAKLLVQGMASGSEQKAHDAGKAARDKFLARRIAAPGNDIQED
jgi:hypothetical protein